MDRKKIIKDIISSVFSFFIAISFTVVCICMILSKGIFNKELFLSVFSETEFYEDTIGSLNSNLSDRLKTVGLPEECGEDVFKSGVVTVDINKAMSQIVNNMEVDIDYRKPGNVLRNNIIGYLNAKGITVDQDVRKAVNLIVVETEKDYQTHISFRFVKMFYSFFEKYESSVKVFRNIAIAVLIISSFAMLFIRTKVYRGVRYIEYGILAGSILTYVMTFIMRHSIVQYIPDEHGAYSDLISLFISKSFSQGKYMLLAGILIVVIVNLFNRYLKKQVI